MSEKRVTNMYLPKNTVEALDEACKGLPIPFNRSEMANLAIREGLPRALARFGRIPKLVTVLEQPTAQHTSTENVSA